MGRPTDRIFLRMRVDDRGGGVVSRGVLGGEWSSHDTFVALLQRGAIECETKCSGLAYEQHKRSL